MAVLMQTSLSKFNLTEEEYIAGSQLTVAQIQVIQNMLSTAALQRLALEVDTTNLNAFIQREAELKGEINILQHILDTDQDIKASLNQSPINL